MQDASLRPQTVVKVELQVAHLCCPRSIFILVNKNHHHQIGLRLCDRVVMTIKNTQSYKVLIALTKLSRF